MKVNRAFTLIELLVVIAIIAILAAILFPTITRAKKYVSRPVDASNMHQLYLALMLYEGDDNGVDPLTLAPLEPYTHSTAVFASKWDVYRKPAPDKTWFATPLQGCSEEGFVPFKISYAYLRTFLNADETDRWNQYRQNSMVGIFASPWTSDPGTISDFLLNSPVCGVPLIESTGPPMNGPMLRINMDGSLYILPQNKFKGWMGNINDLFFTR